MYKYQLIFIGASEKLIPEIATKFTERVKDLGLPDSSIQIIYDFDFKKEYKNNCPSVAIYFGHSAPFSHLDILKQLIKDAVFILPVVSNLNEVHNLLPEEIRPLNAFLFSGVDSVESIVARSMEMLSLLRASRRLFISYRRVESRSIAIQLYEFLDQQGFDVFLDTHSIKQGETFQDELWHRLVDTDVVVLLDTPKFLESKWTEQELAKASAMSVAILQIIWPNHSQVPYSSFCFPIYLKDHNFEDYDYSSINAHLKEQSLSQIGNDVESLRARSLAARQDILIQEFTSTATNLKIKVSLQPEKFITVIKKSDGKEVCIIPTVGVPHALTYNQGEDLITKIKSLGSKEVILLYDHRNILKKWQTHLSWLDKHLPVKALKLTDIESWIKNIAK